MTCTRWQQLKHKRVRFLSEQKIRKSLLGPDATRKSCPVEVSLSVIGIGLTSSFREAGRGGNCRRRRRWSVIRVSDRIYNDTAALKRSARFWENLKKPKNLKTFSKKPRFSSSGSWALSGLCGLPYALSCVFATSNSACCYQIFFVRRMFIWRSRQEVNWIY